MNKNLRHIVILFAGLLVLGLVQSCTHDPFLPEDFEPEPQDTMVMDTMVVDTMQVGISCDTTLVYYMNQIQPILRTSCATTYCHDATSATAGVILDNYENVIATTQLVPYDLVNSLLYTVITSDDEDAVMPPTGKLENEQINLIALWILQGAENLECEEPCNSSDVGYSAFVSDVMEQYCNACHSTASASGNIVTDNHAMLEVIAKNGKLYGTINWDEGFSMMPQSQEKLDSCTIIKIKSWIDEGAQNN